MPRGCIKVTLMLIEAMTMPEFEQRLEQSRTVLIPVGSVEEHGPHLPLGTDTIHAYEVCRLAGNEPALFWPRPCITGSAAAPVSTRGPSAFPETP